MKRRDFLGVAAGACALSACGPAPTPATSPTPQGTPQNPWFKDPSPFLEHGGKNLETRLENLDGFLTPNDLFFVRNNAASIEVKPETYVLKVTGEGVRRPLELKLEELKSMPCRTLFSIIECGGNQRAMFDLVKGKKGKGTQWKTGGVSNACWTGVPLLEVLLKAEVDPEAVDVMLIGLDLDAPEEGFRRAIPVEKAMDPDTLLAFTMNGEPLPKDHGYPIRAVVPGWVGSSSIKWLGTIEVSKSKVWSRNNTTSYSLVGEDYPPQGESEGVPITEQTLKSALALPWPAQLKAGPVTLHGYAHSPRGPIRKVEWSSDGKNWQLARLTSPPFRYAWMRFQFDWEATAGEHTLWTRATDGEGRRQPEEIPHNTKGYLFNQPLPHPVKVS